MKTFRVVLAFGLTIALSGLAQAGVLLTPNPTGTWSGKVSCNGIFQSAKFKGKAEGTLQLTSHLNNELSAQLSVENDDSSFSLQLDGCGFVVSEGGNTEKGKLMLHGLDFDLPFERFFTLNVTSLKLFPPNKKGVSGKLKGVIALAEKPQSGQLTCTIAMERTDQVDPALPGCSMM